MTRADRRAHRLALWTAIIVTVLWSSSWVLVRIGLEDDDLRPLTFAGLRYVLASLLLACWVAARPGLRREAQRLDRRSLGWLAILGVVFYAFTQGAQFVAIDSQPAATTSLVLSLTPLLVGVVGARSLREAPTTQQYVGAIVVAVGAWVYFAGDLGATAVGMAAALVGLAANAGGSLLGRSVNRGRRWSPVVVTTVSMSIGSAVLLAVGLVVEGVPVLTAHAWLLLLWLAVVNTAVAFTLWNRSLVRLTAIESAGINNTMLVQIALLAWLFLDEPPGLPGVAGILLVSVGVFFTQASTATFRPAGARSTVA